MSRTKKLWLSIGIGWGIKLIPILLYYVFFESEIMAKIAAIANIDGAIGLILAGKGPLLGYDQQGNPMYEGTPVHLVFAFLGFLSGFVIYPIIIYIAMTIFQKLKELNNLPKT